MAAIRPLQIWEETISGNETRRFKVMNVLSDQVEVLDVDQRDRDHAPHGRLLNGPDIIGNPNKYKLIEDAE